jgi:iron(III) transport system ATP-binding protein
VAGLFGDYNLLRGPDAQQLAAAPLATGTALLVRPEQLHVGASGSKGLSGTVRAVRFLGSYYEIEIQLPASVVRARASAALAPGAAVAVGLAPGAGWPLAAGE